MGLQSEHNASAKTSDSDDEAVAKASVHEISSEAPAPSLWMNLAIGLGAVGLGAIAGVALVGAFVWCATRGKPKSSHSTGGRKRL